MKVSIKQLKAIAAEVGRFDVPNTSYPQDITLNDQSPNMRGDLLVKFTVVSPSNTRGLEYGFVVSLEGADLTRRPFAFQYKHLTAKPHATQYPL